MLTHFHYPPNQFKLLIVLISPQHNSHKQQKDGRKLGALLTTDKEQKVLKLI